MPMSKKIPRISKSQYLKGLQCPKALWLYRHRPDLAPEVPASKQQIFDQGHEVGILAQQYFTGGVEVTDKYYDIDKAIASTKNHIRNGVGIIYEATACSPDGAYSRIDILRKASMPDQWDLIEVKQSKGVKDYYLDDMAFQRYAFKNAGYNVRNSYLMRINGSYVRFGPLNLHELFAMEDYTMLVSDKMADIPARIDTLLEITNSDNEPSIEIGNHCKKPFKCDYRHYCRQHHNIPVYSVYEIFGGTKLEQLLEQGIKEISEIPEDFSCTARQTIAINAYKNQEIHVNQSAIREFLNSLVYPLFYLDYETIFPSVPLFDNASPNQQIPFQFSLHIQEKTDGKARHIDFLHTELSDPRPHFVQKLTASLTGKGSVVVYNKAFEVRINNALGHALPQYADTLKNINERMVDLLVPFRSRNLYHPAMQGDASLKSVLPAFVPELNYDDMEISDGEMASIMYMKCLKNQVSEEQKSRIYKNLRDYCYLDTLAEIKLVDVLKRFV